MRAKHGIARGRARRTGKAVAGGAIVCAFYLVAVFADFLAPNDFREQSRR